MTKCIIAVAIFIEPSKFLLHVHYKVQAYVHNNFRQLCTSNKLSGALQSEKNKKSEIRLELDQDIMFAFLHQAAPIGNSREKTGTVATRIYQAFQITNICYYG